MKLNLILLLAALTCACSYSPAPPEDKILFVVSNASYYGESAINTANHFGEIVFAYDEFTKAGYEIDFVSPEGGRVPVGYIYSDSLLQSYLFNERFMELLESTNKPSQLKPDSYKAIFYAGGGSAMFEVPFDEGIQNIATSIYSRDNGVVSAVCHGTAGIANIKNTDGSFLVAGKRVNGFPDIFENKEAAYFQEFPFSIEEQVQRNGGIFNYSSEGWDGYLEVDGKLITGQDPSSSALVAKAVIARLQSKSNP